MLPGTMHRNNCLLNLERNAIMTDKHTLAIADVSTFIKCTIAMRHYDLRMAGHSDEEARHNILTAVTNLLPTAPIDTAHNLI